MLDNKVEIGQNELKKNYGKQFSISTTGPLKNIQIDLLVLIVKQKLMVKIMQVLTRK